jgi:hypothetical protein
LFLGLPLLPISMDTPCVFHNTWQGYFSRNNVQDPYSYSKVYYDIKENCWICYSSTWFYVCVSCISFQLYPTWLSDPLVPPYIKNNMSSNPLLEYLPEFIRQQKTNTQRRLTDFLLREIASDIITFFE